jgi:hypothetical protein
VTGRKSLKSEQDDISTQMAEARTVLSKRFIKFSLLFLSLYYAGQLLHWLLDFPSSTKPFDVALLVIGTVTFCGIATEYAGTLILEFRLRLERLDKKVTALESRPLAANMREAERDQDEENESAEDESDEELLAKYRASAQRGEGWGQYNLGAVYSNGTEVPEDKVQAAYWFRKAAEQGDYASRFFLARLLDQGEGMPPDYSEALGLYQIVAEEGGVLSSLAEYHIGEIYAKGNGVPRNYAEAIKHWKKSAHANGWLAMNELGKLFESGTDVVPQNFKEAYFWYSIEIGISDPKKVPQYRIERRDKMASHLTPEKGRT